MRYLVLLSLFVVGTFADAFGAVESGRSRGGVARRATSGAAQGQSVSGRATVSRSATNTTTGNVRARSAAPVATKPSVVARAASTQKVIGTGTKVASAAKNLLVDETCQAKYEGCMDSFCMLDNDTGGRCLCSDKNAELDAILLQIEELDLKTYQMATVGVEKIEMGSKASDVIAAADAAAAEAMGNSDGSSDKATRRSLTASLWDVPVEEEEDLFAFAPESSNGIDGKEGDALYLAADSLCTAQIPECAASMDMLKMLYGQRVKSDCTAYENSLKQQKLSSQQKLTAAEQALRSAALEQFQATNKYDLGQCTIEFRKCMQKTGGCGDDFSGCASVAAVDTTNTRKYTSKFAAGYKIQGPMTAIEISASTYDTLEAKKILCEHITDQCVKVKDKVWDAFLRESAPQIKSAELIAEDNIRQSCIGNISDCFQKACQDNMDPNNPDASYDLCLSRPGNMLNVCQIPLNACGVNTDSVEAAEESIIWEYVTARLASIRTNACTDAVRECIQADDRCGKDYLQCIGLDTDSIIRMCPADKLVACQMQYGDSEDDILEDEEVYMEISDIVQGIMLNIDNELMAECQRALDEAMVAACGSTENCDGMTVDEKLGSRSLEYDICQYDGFYGDYCVRDVTQITDEDLGRGCKEIDKNQVGVCIKANERKSFAGRISGEIPWQDVGFIDENGQFATSAMQGISKKGMTETEKKNINTELELLKGNIEAVIKTIEADPTVQFCMTGRTVQGIDKVTDQRVGRSQVVAQVREKQNVQSIGEGARFPKLTNHVRNVIAQSALKKAQENYSQRYNELLERMARDYVTIGERIAEIDGENALDARREHARASCVALPQGTALISGGHKREQVGKTVEKKLVGSQTVNRYNYKETVTATFAWENLVCTKCVRKQACASNRRKFCKRWGKVEEKCEEIQF